MRRFLLATLSTCTVFLGLSANAWALDDYYGGYNICGSHCYIQTNSAHTWRYNEGLGAANWSTVTCQVYNT